MDSNQGRLSQENVQIIKTLGSSQLDMYCGDLTIYEVLQQIISYLLQQGIAKPARYKQWVGNGYKLCPLTYGVVFTFQHIQHIKPAHPYPESHVPNTISVKANGIKVLYVICWTTKIGAI